ncbi:sulfite exporter TauE/SafE family protein, partial [Candidatus Pelagibacter sp.]|nr:sulfite exporter TauE/SafE family protein [Candidatus Pelagibacter sp.]
MIILSIFFLITSILYSSVGFGGGSTYIALMLIWEIPFFIIPILALCCNIIVVSGNSINYVRSGNFNFQLLFPYLLGSIPFAFFGASISISKELFEITLFVILFIAGISLLIESKSFNNDEIKLNSIPKVVSIFIGSIIGFISGIVGIGGGIFLSPILFLIKAGYPKHIATTASLFILINSIFGVAGQLTKDIVFDEFLNYWPLFLCVLAGGQIGNFLN